MLSAIAIAKLLLTLGPAIIQFMMELEKLFPENGKGQEKLTLIRGYIQGLWGTLGTAVPSFEEMWPKIETVIGVVKSVGKGTIFKKK